VTDSAQERAERKALSLSSLLIREDLAAPLHGQRAMSACGSLGGTRERVENPQRARIAVMCCESLMGPWSDQNIRNIFEAGGRPITVKQGIDSAGHFMGSGAVGADVSVHEVERNILRRQIGQRAEYSDAINLWYPPADILDFD
jgi:hypothetical protein